MRKNIIDRIAAGSLSGYAQDYLPSEARIVKTVGYLASDKLKGRGTGEKGGEKASKYVKRQFSALGLEPGNHGSWYQDFTFDRGKHTGLKSRNVIAYLDNGAAYTIIIGAHYDHLGRGELFDGKYPPGQIHNGADDNASGVAVIPGAGAILRKERHEGKFQFHVHCFRRRGAGVEGSKYYVKNPVDSLANIHFMLNMDMIGRYNPERGVGIGGYGTAEEWPEIFKGVDRRCEVLYRCRRQGRLRLSQLLHGGYTGVVLSYWRA